MNGGILVGGGGHADDIWATLNHHMPIVYPWRRVDHHSEWFGVGGETIIGINNPGLRERISRELHVEDISWIHPHTFIGPDCTIGTGTHINYGVTMTRTTIGHHTTVAPGVTICGDVTIGDRVFIGAGATIRNLVTIGDDAFICMGAIVTRDVEPGEKYR